MKKYRNRMLATLVVAWGLVAIALPGAAFAQTEAISLENTTIQAQVWSEAGGQSTLIIVGATLATDTPLPATVELPLPQGADVQWAGEIEGLDPANDVQVDFEIVPATGGSALRFTVTQYRSFQYEAFLPSPTVNGSSVSVTLDWLQTVPSQDVSLAWKLPAGVQNVVLDPDAPGQPISNEVGETLYTLLPVSPQVGDSVVFTASYDTGAGTTTDAGGSLGVLPVVIGLLLIAVVVLVIVISRQRGTNASDE